MRSASSFNANTTRTITESTSSLETKMQRAKTYLQNCPVCGRPLEIPVEYRGRALNCRHCGGHFNAIDPASSIFAAQNSSSALLRRAEQLIKLSERKLRVRVAG
jgi:hypothetical protein